MKRLYIIHATSKLCYLILSQHRTSLLFNNNYNGSAGVSFYFNRRTVHCLFGRFLGRPFGLLDLRTIGHSDYWTFGLSYLRTIGLSDYRTFGLLGFRIIRPQDYWTFGLSGLRTFGLLGRHPIVSPWQFADLPLFRERIAFAISSEVTFLMLLR